jgi:hypothetical protein
MSLLQADPLTHNGSLAPSRGMVKGWSTSCGVVPTQVDHKRFEARPDHVGSVLQSGVFGLLELEWDERGGGDGADSPAIEGDAFEGLPDAFEEGVGAFGAG